MNLKDLLRTTGRQDMVIEGRAYHSPLPKDLESFYCYLKDAGHCIMIVLPNTDGRVEDHTVPIPVKAVLRIGYAAINGYVYCDVPYDPFLGAVCDPGDYEIAEASDTMSGIVVTNDGMLIEATNYWLSNYAKHGYAFFSVNAGCVRLLLPESPSSVSGSLDDRVLDQTQYVIISRGKHQRQDAYEVLFEDGSSSPYVIFTLDNQWDRLIATADSGRTDIAFHVYRSGRLVRQMNARFRVVDRLPCLEPWT